MCFGPVASFTASAVLASMGTAILGNIRSKKEILFAAFPMLFALQQLIEGFLWVIIQKQGPEVFLHGLTLGYLTIAYSLWPILCPASVYAIEYDQNRKAILRALLVLGTATSLYLFYFITRNPFLVTIINCGIRYKTFVAGAHLFTAVYVIVTVLPYFISSHKSILVFGIPNLIFFMVAYFFYRWAFISVWCFFAAVLSLTLYVFLRRLHHDPVLSL